MDRNAEPYLLAQLESIVRASSWMMRALSAVRDLGVRTAWIGAGAIRNVVWDAVQGVASPTLPNDVDVVYFNADDLSQAADDALRDRLADALPDLPWEVTNQAAVHVWFERYFGYPVEPLQSVGEAVRTWPETATCVALRLVEDDSIEVIAPFGLRDLFDMVVRWNPARITREGYLQRIRTKRYDKRWPNVRIVLDR